MNNFRNSKHIEVQHRVSEYEKLKEIHTQINDYKNLTRGTPMNEEQVLMEGMDLDLNFLNGFVQEQ